MREPKILPLGRKVAFKTLPSEFSCDLERLRRFEQEARAASALSSPNATHIYDIGESDGLRFIAKEVMSFLGRKLHGNFEGEIVSDLSSLVCRRTGGPGIKHRVKENWFNMYDSCTFRTLRKLNAPAGLQPSHHRSDVHTRSHPLK